MMLFRSLLKHSISAALLLALILFSGVRIRATSSKEPKSEGERLIAQAQAISSGFSPEERADLLLDILDTPAGRFVDNGRKWSLELYSISRRQLQPGPYRAAVQKNALIDLANVDPVKAAQLFKSQDTPDMWNQPGRVEDYRAWVARALFPKLWDKSGMSSLIQLKDFADWMGGTGEYPYVAMIGIVQAVAKVDETRAEQLVSDATGFYLTNPPFANKHREFTTFILGIADHVHSSSTRRAIEAELDALESEKKNTDPNQVKFVIQASDSRGTVQFNQQAEYVVYRLLPLINRLDPEWAKSVKAKYEVLQYLPEPGLDSTNTRMAAVAVSPDLSPSSPQVAAAMDDHRLFQVEQLAQNDPEKAAEIAAAIRDPGRKAIAQVTLVSAYNKLDPGKAASWGDEANHELESLPAGKVKLRLMVAMSISALEQNRQDRALELFKKAFDLGEMLFSEDLKENPGKMTYAGEGEQELATLVTDFSRNPKVRPVVLEQTRTVHNDVLKAKLFVAAAKGALSMPAATESH